MPIRLENVGLNGNHANIAMLQTPEATVASRHGCHPLRGVATYQDVYKLTYVRGPSDILVMLAEALQKD